MIEVDENFRKLHVQIEMIIKDGLYRNRKVECCPICGFKKYIKYGRYKGIQRFKCKSESCGKTFSKTTNSMWSYSKKSSKKWIEFMELMMEKKSLRYCAKILEISLGTAFYWRHKILNGFAQELIPNKLCSEIHIGKAVITENFKGCRDIKTSNREQIWIIAASSGEDVILSVPVCKKVWNLKSFEEKVYSKIDRSSCITAYFDRYLEAVARKHNKELEKKENSIDNRIKYFRSNLNSWKKCFCGIGTKYLNGYLCWFILFYLDRKVDCISMSYDLIRGNNFIRTNEIRVCKEAI